MVSHLTQNRVCSVLSDFAELTRTSKTKLSSIMADFGRHLQLRCLVDGLQLESLERQRELDAVRALWRGRRLVPDASHLGVLADREILKYLGSMSPPTSAAHDSPGARTPCAKQKGRAILSLEGVWIRLHTWPIVPSRPTCGLPPRRLHRWSLPPRRWVHSSSTDGISPNPKQGVFGSFRFW